MADNTKKRPEDEDAIDRFIRDVGPVAQRVGEQLGVAPELLIAQWGHETGWGKKVVPGTNNYGNIKDFSGRGVAATDNMTGSRDRYRAYDSPDAFGDDFARLIGGNQRYRDAVGTGSDARAYATGLHRGGYAEDAAYVDRIDAAARTVRGRAGLPEAQSSDTDWETMWKKPAHGLPVAASEDPAAPAKPASMGDWLNKGRQDQGGVRVDDLPSEKRNAIINQGHSVGGYLGDSAAGLANAAIKVLGSPITGLAPSSDLAATIRGWSDTLESLKSPYLRAKKERAQDRIALEDGELGKFASGVGEYASSFALMSDFGVEQIPNVLAIIGPGKLFQMGAKGLGWSAAAAESAGMVGARIAATGLGGAQGRDQAYTEFLSDPGIEKMPEFKELAGRVGKEEARKQLAADLSRVPGSVAALASAVFGTMGLEKAVLAPGRAGLAKLGTRAGLKAGAKAVAGENIGELGEELPPQIAQNAVARETFDPAHPILEGVGVTAAQTLVASGPFSAIAGVKEARHIYTEADLPKPTAAPNSPLTQAAHAAGATPEAQAAAAQATQKAQAAQVLNDALVARAAAMEGWVKQNLERLRRDPRFDAAMADEAVGALARIVNPKIDMHQRLALMDKAEEFMAAVNKAPNFKLGEVVPPETAPAPDGDIYDGTPISRAARPMGRESQLAGPQDAGALPPPAFTVDGEAREVSPRAALDATPQRGAALPAPQQRVALPAPTTEPDGFVVDGQGAATPARNAERAAQAGREAATQAAIAAAERQRRANLGLTPDVERAQEAREAPETRLHLAPIPTLIGHGFTQLEGRDLVNPATGKRYPLGSNAAIAFARQRLATLKRSDEGRADAIGTAAHVAATSAANETPVPTEAQKKAGNYKKGHVRIDGLDVSIENPQGSQRTGKSDDGKEWSVTMPAHYGYIKRSRGADGDHVDLFVGPKGENKRYWIVNQNHPGSTDFDEHKVVTGVDSADEARALYMDSFTDGFGAKVFSSISPELDSDALRAELPKLKKAMPTAPILQNRDRSSAASVLQMQSIAAAPDYGRLGFSRSLSDGAPVVFSNRDVLKIPEDRIGRTDYATDASGARIPVRYAVVEAGAVLASHDADGTQNGGYAEDRTPGQLRVVAGNGRMAGLHAAYRKGTAGDYRAEMIAEAPGAHGITPDVIEAMGEPVLVRIMPASAVTDDIGDRTNTRTTAELSVEDQARTDAGRVDLSALDFNEDGSPSNEALRRFVEAMPPTEQAGLLDGTRPNARAVLRLKAAVFWAGYQSDALLNLVAAATDPDALTLLNALMRAAPDMARLDGLGDYDVRSVVVEAAELGVNAARQGIAFAKAVQQVEIGTSPGTVLVLAALAPDARSSKRMGETLQDLARSLAAEADKTDDMFGAAVRLTPQEVLSGQRTKDDREEGSDARGPEGVGVEGGPRGAGGDAAQPQAASGGAGPGEDAAQGAGSGQEVAADDLRQIEGINREEWQRRADEAHSRAERIGSRAAMAAADDFSDGTGTLANFERRLDAAEAQERSAGGDLLLDNPTPQDLKRREAEAARAAADKKAAEDRANAPDPRDFLLTGSDRETDVRAAGGQAGLFGEEAGGTPAAEPAIKAWHTAVPTKGLPIEPKDAKDYQSVVFRIAKDAADAVTQAQKLGNIALYAYVFPAADGRHGIARLFPDDQTPPAPWKLLNGEALRPGFVDVTPKLRGWLSNAPILGEPKAERPKESKPAVADSTYGERFQINMNSMMGAVRFRASAPVQMPQGARLLVSEILVREDKFSKIDADTYGLPRKVPAWRLSVVENESGEPYSMIEAMGDNHGRTPDGEVVAYFTEIRGHALDALDRSAPVVAKAARRLYDQIVSSRGGMFDEPAKPQAGRLGTSQDGHAIHSDESGVRYYTDADGARYESAVELKPVTEANGSTRLILGPFLTPEFMTVRELAQSGGGNLDALLGKGVGNPHLAMEWLEAMSVERARDALRDSGFSVSEGDLPAGAVLRDAMTDDTYMELDRAARAASITDPNPTLLKFLDGNEKGAPAVPLDQIPADFDPDGIPGLRWPERSTLRDYELSDAMKGRAALAEVGKEKDLLEKLLACIKGG